MSDSDLRALARAAKDGGVEECLALVEAERRVGASPLPGCVQVLPYHAAAILAWDEFVAKGGAVAAWSYSGSASARTT